MKPGSTPPESQSATASPEHKPSPRPPRTVLTTVIVSALALLAVLFFVAYAVGLLD